jgi:protein gp37
MSTATRIEWTRGDDGSAGATWNPVTGCTRVSAGCDHCYAATLARRLKAMGNPRYQADGPGFGVTLHPDKLAEPLGWRKPRRVFVNSMSDLSGGVTILTSSFSQFRAYVRPSLRLRRMSRTGAGISPQQFGVQRRRSLASQRGRYE